MTNPDKPDLDALLVDARKALRCLHNYVSPSVALDVWQRIEAAFDGYDLALKAVLARESEGREDTARLDYLIAWLGEEQVDELTSRQQIDSARAARHPEKREGGS